jgi:hypothetical protein
VSAGDERAVVLVRNGKHPHIRGRDSARACVLFMWKERTVSPIVTILVVILILSLLGGGYGFRSGNTVLGAGGGVVGLILLIVLILALLGRLPL